MVVDSIQSVLASVEGVGPKIAELLQKAGFTTVEKLANVEIEHLCTVQGIGDKTATRIIEGAKKYLAEHAAPAAAQTPTEEAAHDNNQENN